MSWRVACVLTTIASCMGAAAAQARPTINCARLAGDPVHGPCQTADTLGMTFAPGAMPMRSDWALSLNFGLAWSQPDGTVTVICEEAYKQFTPEEALLDGAGWIYAPGFGGLRRSRAEDGCTWQAVTGFLAETFVRQVLAVPGQPGRLLALAVDGVTRVLYTSTDGGASFKPGFRFPEKAFYWRMDLAPSNPQVIWANGTGLSGSFALARSDNGGATFTIRDPLPALGDDPARVAVLRGIAPDNPDVLYFGRSARMGAEELWKSNDGGNTATRKLSLSNSEVVSAVVFGDDARTIYVSGWNLFYQQGVPIGHLYVSRDAGETWETPRPSMVGQGPSYRCLRRAGGKLWACGAAPETGDPFLLGTSSDEGKTWQPVLTTATLPPPRACVASLCPQTVDWLCNTYNICGEIPDGGAPGDAGVGVDAGVVDASNDAADAGGALPADPGCDCNVGGGRGSSAALFPGLWLCVLAVRRLRARRAGRQDA